MGFRVEGLGFRACTKHMWEFPKIRGTCWYTKDKDV